MNGESRREVPEYVGAVLSADDFKQVREQRGTGIFLPVY